jgi:ketosteroid isomerase-like protein
MITIEANTIYDKAVEFASFEAGRGVQDDAMYPTLMINSRDKAFIQSYGEQAMGLIGGSLKFCIEEYDLTESGDYAFSFRPDCTLSIKEKRTERYLTEAMTAYVMSRWLDNKLPERAKAYAQMYADMASILVNSAERVRPKIKE